MILYIVKCQQFYKIGSTRDINSRMQQLATGNPFDITIEKLYSFKNSEIVERSLHQKFEKQRHRGEWFILDEDSFSDIDNICHLLGGLDEKIIDSEITIYDNDDVEDDSNDECHYASFYRKEALEFLNNKWGESKEIPTPLEITEYVNKTYSADINHTNSKGFWSTLVGKWKLENGIS